MAYTSKTAKELRNEGGTLLEKVASELALIDTEIAAVELGDLELSSGEILVGSSDDAAAAVTPSGDVTISNTGVLTIGNAKIEDGMLDLPDGKIFIGATGGTGISAALSGDVTMTNAGVVTLAASAIGASKLDVADGTIIVGDGDGEGAEVTLSGDVTMTNAGVVTIGDAKIEDGMLDLPDGKIFIGATGDTGISAALSGDVTMTNAGVTTIGDGKVEDGMLDLPDGKIFIGATGDTGISAALSGDVTMTNAGVTTVGAGKISEAMHVAASLSGTIAKVVASANTGGGIPVLFRRTIPNTAGDYDATMDYKILVTDFWIVSTGAAAHATDDTVQLKNGATAISDALAKTATQYSVIRSATLNSPTINAAGTLRLTVAKDTNCACEAYVLGIRVT
ncbi:hypothetical protein D4R86_05730 [bacterium]|nr:MAG: hypothetical protein D4R86_05730 [bacterium]